jgi:hypothetical protein
LLFFPAGLPWLETMPHPFFSERRLTFLKMQGVPVPCPVAEYTGGAAACQRKLAGPASDQYRLAGCELPIQHLQHWRSGR